MGLFSSGSSKVKIVDPLAGQKVTAADYLTSLLTREAPLQQVADLTDIEKYGQDYLTKYAKSEMPGGYTTSYDYLNKMLNEPTDITKLPEYEAILKSINATTNEAVNRAMRRTQLSGMGTSTPQGRAVGREIRLGEQNLLAGLSPLAENERNRRMSASSMLSQLAQIEEAIKQGRLGSIYTYGGLPRQLSQAELDAQYQQQLFPWTYQAPAASSIFGGNVDYTVSETPSILEQLSPLLGSALEAYGTYKASDKRVKENIQEVDNAIDKIKKLKAFSYNYKTTDPKDRRVGVIAQDVERIMPEAVKVINGIKHVDYAAVTALATEAVNELIDEVKKLKKKKAA